MPPQIPPDQYFAEQARSNEARVGNAQTLPVNRQDPAPEPPPSPMSRRSILRGVAGVGAVGAAAAVGAGAVVAFDKSASAQTTLKPAAKPVVMAPMAPTAMGGPLIVYISDTTNGLLDVFGGTGATQVRNPALVRQLLANLPLA
jgi:hypothetical protein